MKETERPIEIKLDDSQIEWIIKNPTDKILELWPDEQADQVIVTSMKNCIDLLDWYTETDSIHADDIEEHKRLRDACLLIIKHFGTEPEE